jgi:hypothetical protein
MCAPHQATLMQDCTPNEALMLLGIAGYNANSEFLDLYLRASSSNGIYGDLRWAAENRAALKAQLLSYPDTPEGGRAALDSLRSLLRGSPCCKALPLATAEESPPQAKKSCCH